MLDWGGCILEGSNRTHSKMRVSLNELREDAGKFVRNPAGVMLLQCSDLLLKATVFEIVSSY